MAGVEGAELDRIIHRCRELLGEDSETVADAPPLFDFVQSCLIIDKESGGLVPFRLWDAQKEALEFLLAHPYAIVAKARQLGLTWLVLALMLYEGRFGGNRSFPIARQSEGYAKDAIRRLLILAGYDPDSDLSGLRVLPESANLMDPEWRPRFVAKNLNELRERNGSTWTAYTATRSLGRGLVGYRGLADEFAFWPWPARQRKALESGCARLDIVSTGNGEGDDFHETWELAVEGKGIYRPLFVSAEAHPGRDARWFREHVDEDSNPDSASREHARRPEEAFRAPEGAFFKRFARDRHVKEVAVQLAWPTWRAVDFGFRHPACLWVQRAPSGQLLIIGELLPENVTTMEFRDAIVERDGEYAFSAPPVCTYCDPAGKGIDPQTAETEFEVFKRARLRPRGKPSGVRDGCVRIMDVLADPDLPLIVSDACPGLIRALSQVKPLKGHEERYDTEHPFSDPLDALRYLLINLRDVGAGTPSGGPSRPGPVPTRQTVF